jgi:hypothetical protein
MFKKVVGLSLFLAASFGFAHVAFADKEQKMAEQVHKLSKQIAEADEAGNKERVKELCKSAKAIEKERHDLPENRDNFIANPLLGCKNDK